MANYLIVFITLMAEMGLGRPHQPYMGTPHYGRQNMDEMRRHRSLAMGQTNLEEKCYEKKYKTSLFNNNCFYHLYLKKKKNEIKVFMSIIIFKVY